MKLIDPMTEGYKDGLEGKDPNPEYDCEEYSDGWLFGCQDREAGMKPVRFLGYYEESELPLKRGQDVTIKKGTQIKSMGSKGVYTAGRTFKVTVNHFGGGCAGYYVYGGRGEFRRPTPVTVVWSGAGGYWSEVPLDSLPELP